MTEYYVNKPITYTLPSGMASCEGTTSPLGEWDFVMPYSKEDLKKALAEALKELANKEEFSEELGEVVLGLIKRGAK